MNKKQVDSGEVFAVVLLAWPVVVILGSLTGIWIKLFWAGWVFA